jgi:hypothetical protein
VPDWEEIMGARLHGLGASAEQQSEIATELAGHLEDLYERARLEGLSEHEAAARALVVIGDEAELRRRISLALRGGEFMGDWKKSFWMPALFIAAAQLWIWKLIRWHMFEVALRNHHGGPIMLISPVSLMLEQTLVPILAGAIGGLWSWLAGGRFWQRLLAGLSIWLAVPVTLLMSAVIGLLRGFPPHYYWLAWWSQHFFRQTTLREVPYLLLGVFPFLLLKVHPPRAQAHS